MRRELKRLQRKVLNLTTDMSREDIKVVAAQLQYDLDTVQCQLLSATDELQSTQHDAANYKHQHSARLHDLEHAQHETQVANEMVKELSSEVSHLQSQLAMNDREAVD